MIYLIWFSSGYFFYMLLLYVLEGHDMLTLSNLTDSQKYTKRTINIIKKYHILLGYFTLLLVVVLTIILLLKDFYWK